MNFGSGAKWGGLGDVACVDSTCCVAVGAYQATVEHSIAEEWNRSRSACGGRASSGAAIAGEPGGARAVIA